MLSRYLKDTVRRGGGLAGLGSGASCKSDHDFVGLMGIVSLVDLAI